MLQYVDDLLITRASFQHLTNTIATLNHMASCGYKVSAQKAQICQQAVRFLGFLLEPGKRSLTGNRNKTIIQMRVHNMKKGLRGFLGMAGYCCIWIPNFGLIANPLYKALKGLEYSPLTWTKEYTQAFESLKAHLASAPA